MKPAEARIFHVQAEQANQTLATALRAWLKEPVSWSQVRRLVRTRHVLLNGNLCLDEGRRLKPREVVKVLAHPAAPLPREEDVRIRFVDAHLVIVEKPAGMTSVRHAEEQHWSAKRRRHQPTLEDLLPRILAKKQSSGRRSAGKGANGRGGGRPQPARTPPVKPVHRLDRDTSGLMVFARTAQAERLLGEQFRKHTTRRRYLAVARGVVAPQVIESNLVRDRGDGRRGSTTEPGQGKRAVTHIRPIEPLGEYTLIECRLETGRTHQIRIHLAEIGHALLGETIYHRPRFGEETPDRSGAPRLALHATALAIRHPMTGEELSYEMPLPPDLAEFLERLRKQAGREPA